MKIFSRCLILATVTACLPVFACASTPLGDFESHVGPGLIKPFALDLGGLLGSASVGPAQSYGFPGFEIGIVGVVQARPDKSDMILRTANVKQFGLPLIEAGVGLPFNIDVVAHGMSYDGAKILGGGVRYGLFKSGLTTLILPSVGVAAFGDVVDDHAFHASHLGLNAEASWGLPIVTPFIGAGLDTTRVKVGAALYPGMTGLSQTATGSRFNCGIDIAPLPFTRIRLAYLALHGQPGGEVGLLVKF